LQTKTHKLKYSCCRLVFRVKATNDLTGTGFEFKRS
jgi:hypothetical protein